MAFPTPPSSAKTGLNETSTILEQSDNANGLFTQPLFFKSLMATLEQLEDGAKRLWLHSVDKV